MRTGNKSIYKGVCMEPGLEAYRPSWGRDRKKHQHLYCIIYVTIISWCWVAWNIRSRCGVAWHNDLELLAEVTHSQSIEGVEDRKSCFVVSRLSSQLVYTRVVWAWVLLHVFWHLPWDSLAYSQTPLRMCCTTCYRSYSSCLEASRMWSWGDHRKSYLPDDPWPHRMLNTSIHLRMIYILRSQWRTSRQVTIHLGLTLGRSVGIGITVNVDDSYSPVSMHVPRNLRSSIISTGWSSWAYDSVSLLLTDIDISADVNISVAQHTCVYFRPARWAAVVTSLQTTQLHLVCHDALQVPTECIRVHHAGSNSIDLILEIWRTSPTIRFTKGEWSPEEKYMVSSWSCNVLCMVGLATS